MVHTTPLLRRLAAGALLASAVILTLFSCDYPSGQPTGNTLPTTELANVPPNDTVALYYRLGAIPEFTLYWRGGDPDGYVTAFRYRWTTTRENGTSATTPWSTMLNISSFAGVTLPQVIGVAGQPQSIFRIYNFLVTLSPQDLKDTAAIRLIGDSLITGRAFAVPYQDGPVQGDSIFGADPLTNPTPTKGMFIFNSPDSANRQLYEIVAVDNNDSEDPTPANVTFWTQRSPQPTITITGRPAGGSWAIRYITERWTGLVWTFGFQDPSTFEQQFSFSVDDTLHWSPWIDAPRAVVTALDFRSGTTNHTLYARCRNRWGAISRTVSEPFTAFVPIFDDPATPPRTLIINNDCKLATSPPLTPDTNQVMAFYREVMDSLGRTGRYDIWNTASLSGRFPNREVLGAYSSVVLVSEHPLSNLGFAGRAFLIDNSSKQPLLANYLQVGGKLIYSCGPEPGNVWPSYDAWSNTYWHTQPGALTAPNGIGSTQRDFTGANGRFGYPSVTLEPTKFHPDSTVTPGGSPALRNMALHPPRGFAETIYSYVSGTGQARYNGGPLGIRYLAPPPVPPGRQTYSVVNLGFPLYYVRKSGAIGALRSAFTDVND
jgi:hypothetical protein